MLFTVSSLNVHHDTAAVYACSETQKGNSSTWRHLLYVCGTDTVPEAEQYMDNCSRPTGPKPPSVNTVKEREKNLMRHSL